MEKNNTYYWKNRDKILERQRKYFKAYYEKNKEKIQAKNSAYMKVYYEQNKAAHNERCKQINRAKKNRWLKHDVTIKQDILVKFTF
jgi:hypothetical protein